MGWPWVSLHPSLLPHISKQALVLYSSDQFNDITSLSIMSTPKKTAGHKEQSQQVKSKPSFFGDLFHPKRAAQRPGTYQVISHRTTNKMEIGKKLDSSTENTGTEPQKLDLLPSSNDSTAPRPPRRNSIPKQNSSTSPEKSPVTTNKQLKSKPSVGQKLHTPGPSSRNPQSSNSRR